MWNLPGGADTIEASASTATGAEYVSAEFDRYHVATRSRTMRRGTLPRDSGRRGP